MVVRIPGPDEPHQSSSCSMSSTMSAAWTRSSHHDQRRLRLPHGDRHAGHSPARRIIRQEHPRYDRLGLANAGLENARGSAGAGDLRPARLGASPHAATTPEPAGGQDEEVGGAINPAPPPEAPEPAPVEQSPPDEPSAASERGKRVRKPAQRTSGSKRATAARTPAAELASVPVPL